ncbi:DUF2599 domain-containing protein [Isoptericola sp. NPDC019482]|uniref:DUF2599 domain-containing protein n=1 Tax=Isoptericola sp. NPDC019482 TaxID=3154688 RepID=UPI003492A48E
MPHRSPSRAVPALLVLLVPLAVGACSPSAPEPTRSSSASPSPTHAQAARVEVASGDVTLEVSVPGASPDDPRVHVSTGEGTATVSLEPATGDSDGDPPVIALASAGTFEPRVDGSVTVRADGTVVGGLSAPQGGRLVAVDGTHLEVRPGSGETPKDAADITTALGTSAVASTDWGDREGGRSLAVVPTDWAREAGQAGTDLAWAELVAADPEVDTATMHDQLECHAIGAPDKDSWNLEPWRPDVGLVATMAARCNPTP